jgi:hypothetical protein
MRSSLPGMRLGRAAALVVASSLLCAFAPQVASAAPINGSRCAKVGQVKTVAGVRYRCTKVGTHRVWRRVAAQPPGPDRSACAAAASDNASVVGKGPSSTANRTVVIAQDNLWFHGLQDNSAFVSYDGTGQLTSPYQPWIGYYDESYRDVNEKQIALAADNGVDALSQEWIAPLGEPGSLESDLDSAFLQARNLCRIKWALFYDLNLRMGWLGDSSGPPDFDDARVRDTFVRDFTHFAMKYFGQAQYLMVDGRPVVEIWATWNFRGSVDNIQAAVLAARAAVRQRGYDVYLVGDEEVSGPIDRRRVATWDATSSFIPMLMGGTPFAGQDNGTAGLGAATAFVDRANAAWVAGTSGVTVVGSGNPVSFQPGFSPQYDDTQFRRVNNMGGATSLLAMGPDDVRAMAQASLRHAQPVGQTGRGMVWVGTWNNYPESTQIEATQPGSTWPASNTGSAILDATSSVFGREVFGQ